MNARGAVCACAAVAAMGGALQPASMALARPEAAAGPPQQSEAGAPAGASAGELPVLRMHRYTMAGRIRPLLFWIGRGDVGMGEIVWRGTGGAVSYELLIGTDSAKAPRAINRWGYILEDTRPSGTRVLGVMTTSDEATLSDVTTPAGEPQRPGRFKCISARIASGVSQSATETLQTERDFSVREKAAIVGRIEERLKDTARRETVVPPGVRPGFLVAVAELVDNTIAAGKGGGTALRRLKGRKIGYVYSHRLYDLELTGVEIMRASAGGDMRGAPVRASFETRNHSTGNRSTFELEYATDGPLAGVPTLIKHQPRWWLQVVLTLDAPVMPPPG